MALTPRQSALYGHTVNIWRETESFGADGKPGAMAWAQQTTNTPCYADIGKSQQGPNGVLVVENDNLFTFDEFHFEQTITLKIGDTLKMTAGPEVGGFWTVRGDAQIKNRRANMLKVLCSRCPTAPNGVS
jgi:hypothetical protein